MKKTIIGLATATAIATSVNAATVFEKDSSKVEVNGTFGVFLVKAKNQRTDLANDDSHLAFGVSHKISDNVTSLGYSKITFESEEDTGFGAPKLDKLYAGFDVKNVGKFTFGKQFTNGDDVQLNDNAYYIVGGNNNLTSEADKSFKFRSADMHGFSFGLDYIFGQAGKETEDPDLKYGYQISLFYSRELANGLSVDLAAGYGVNRYTAENSTIINSRENNWRTSAKISYGPVSFGAEYGASSKRVVSGNTKSNHILVAASYQLAEPSKIYVQWKRDVEKYKAEGDVSNHGHIFVADKETIQDIIVGVDYKFHKNVVTYLEYATSTIKEQTLNVTSSNEVKFSSKAKGHAIGVGLRVLF